MSRALIIIKTNADKDKAIAWINAAPVGTRVEFKASKRTLPQNDRLHGMLTDLSEQLEWHGEKLKVSDWKLVMMSGLNREIRLVPNIDNDGFVDIGRSTSELTKEELSDLIEVIFAFGARHGVKFYDDYKKLGVRSNV